MTNRFYCIPEITTGSICVADFGKNPHLSFCLEMKVKVDFFVEVYLVLMFFQFDFFFTKGSDRRANMGRFFLRGRNSKKLL